MWSEDLQNEDLHNKSLNVKVVVHVTLFCV